jgi:hypothetical protein
MIKAIETYYNGYRFRSRLEARWAVFFDAAGIKYEYEPQGYDLGDGLYYLPDFYIPDWDAFVEIKPITEYGFNEKANRLAVELSKPVILFAGEPYSDAHYGCRYKTAVYYSDGDVWDTPSNEEPIQLYECKGCDGFVLTNDLETWFIGSTHIERCFMLGGIWWKKRILTAYTKARQARFEHGERG